MSNVEFSKTAKAVLKNKHLAALTVQKMSNLSKEEIEQGRTEIPLADDYKLVIQFGPCKKLGAVSNEGTTSSVPSLKDRYESTKETITSWFSSLLNLNPSGSNKDVSDFRKSSVNQRLQVEK